MKKTYCSLALRFHPDKNKHSRVTEVMRMIIEAKENLESTLRHNNEIREEGRVGMYAMREEERFRMAHNSIKICLMTNLIKEENKYQSPHIHLFIISNLNQTWFMTCQYK